MPALFAFLHHVAAFMLVAMLVVELVLIRGEPTLWRAREAASCRHGPRRGGWSVISRRTGAGVPSEKGASYYVHSVPFLISFLFVVLCAALDLPDNRVSLWRRMVRQGQVPEVFRSKSCGAFGPSSIGIGPGVLVILLRACMNGTRIGTGVDDKDTRPTERFLPREADR